MTSSWTTGGVDGLVRGAELTAHRHLVVSERLRARRRELGLTQKEVVARLRGMGVFTTNKALSALEHGAGHDVAKLPELARALECTLTWLVGLTDSCQQWEPDAEVWRSPRPDVVPDHGSPQRWNGRARSGPGDRVV